MSFAEDGEVLEEDPDRDQLADEVFGMEDVGEDDIREAEGHDDEYDGDPEEEERLAATVQYLHRLGLDKSQLEGLLRHWSVQAGRGFPDEETCTMVVGCLQSTARLTDEETVAFIVRAPQILYIPARQVRRKCHFLLRILAKHPQEQSPESEVEAAETEEAKEAEGHGEEADEEAEEEEIQPASEEDIASLKQLLSHCPGLLVRDVEVLQEAYDFWLSVGVLPRVLRKAVVASSIQANQVFLKKWKLEPKLRFAQEILGLRAWDLLKCDAPYFRLSVMHYIAPRYYFLRQLSLREAPGAKFKCPRLKALIAFGDEKFCRVVARCPLEEYQVFRQEFKRSEEAMATRAYTVRRRRRSPDSSTELVDEEAMSEEED